MPRGRSASRPRVDATQSTEIVARRYFIVARRDFTVVDCNAGLTGRPSLNASTFDLDYCFGADTGEDAVFEAVGRPLVRRALDGQVGVIFAYGQTGSGKTHTMSHLMARVVARLFEGEEGGREITFSHFRRADTLQAGRSAAAAAARTFRGDRSRRDRGRDVGIPRRRVAARPRRGRSAKTGARAAGTWSFWARRRRTASGTVP